MSIELGETGFGPISKNFDANGGGGDETLEQKIARHKRDHPGPQVVVYNPPPPEDPPWFRRLFRRRPVTGSGSTAAAHQSAAMDRKSDG